MRRTAFALLTFLTASAGGPLIPRIQAQSISARAASIRIGGRLHAQYATSSVDDTGSDFFFRRARLIADMTVTDFLGARLQTDFAGGEAQIQDAYVTFAFSPAFELSMGQFKRAFDLFEVSSSTDLSLIERDGRVAGAGNCTGVGGVCTYSRLTEKLGFAGRDQGLVAEGGSGSVSYSASLTNGTGINIRDENDGKSVSGRVSFGASDALSVSAQVGLHDYVDPDDETSYAAAWGADVQYGTWRDGLLVQAAVVRGDNWQGLDAAGAEASFTALQGVVSYFVPTTGAQLSGVEPLFRVSFADGDTDAVDDAALLFTPGLMLYVSGKNKIGFNLDVYSPQRGDTEYGFKVQSFLYF